MDNDRSNEDVGAGPIVLVAVMLAGLVTLLSFLLDDPSGDGPVMQSSLSAHAAVLASPPRDEAAGRPVATSKLDENWASDESARGMRPDAAH